MRNEWETRNQSEDSYGKEAPVGDLPRKVGERCGRGSWREVGPKSSFASICLRQRDPSRREDVLKRQSPAQEEYGVSLSARQPRCRGSCTGLEAWEGGRSSSAGLAHGRCRCGGSEGMGVGNAK